MLTTHLQTLIARKNLTADACNTAIDIMLTEHIPEQIAAFLVLMRAKGETPEEMSAFVQAMQRHQITLSPSEPVIDIVGTGGDQANTANISTGASILTASCAVPVLKHGNRAVSSQSGSADVLEALGLTLTQTPAQINEALQKNHFAFCFAPCFHPALSRIRPIRHALKVPTFFNLLGPLLNPGKAPFIVLGVFDPTLQGFMADILIELGITRAMVVHGNGLDELNCLGPCDVIEIHGNTKKTYQIDPQSLGFPRCGIDDLRGGDARHNAQIIHEVMDNKPSHIANTMILNAAAALYIYGKSNTLSGAIEIIKDSITSGQAKQTLAAITRRDA